MNNRIADIFRTKEGEVVIGQKPNLPLVLSIVFYALRLVEAQLLPLSQIGFILFLAIWALWEITEGVNMWRRLLGTATFLYILARLLS